MHKGFPESITKCYKLYLVGLRGSIEAAYTLRKKEGLRPIRLILLVSRKSAMRINSSWSISIAFSLALAAGSALAGDGDRRGSNHNEIREQLQSQHQDRSRDLRAMPPPPGQQMQPSYPQQIQQPQPQSDTGRRGVRMSPEERRALRRQIDQASHDMYGPGR